MLAAPQGSQTSREDEHTRRNFKFRINEIMHIKFLSWYLEHRKLSINIRYCCYEYTCKGMWREGCHVAQTRIGSTILGAAHGSSSWVICTLTHSAFSLEHHFGDTQGKTGTAPGRMPSSDKTWPLPRRTPKRTRHVEPDAEKSRVH